MKELKAYLITLVMIVMSFVTGCLYRGGNYLDRFFYERATIEEFLAVAESLRGSTPLISLKNVVDYGAKNFVWQQDKFYGFLDYPRDHRAMLSRKRGDCEDFSNFFAHILRYLNVGNPHLFYVAHPAGVGEDRSSGHAVCLVQVEGSYYHISNWENVYGPYTTRVAAAESVHPQFNYYELRDIDKFKAVDSYYR
jgi:hypothetical protein